MTNEAFSGVFTDKALEFSGWNLLNPKKVCFDLSGSNGRTGYLLTGWQRTKICVIIFLRHLAINQASRTKHFVEIEQNC